MSTYIRIEEQQARTLIEALQRFRKMAPSTAGQQHQAAAVVGVMKGILAGCQPSPVVLNSVFEDICQLLALRDSVSELTRHQQRQTELEAA